MGDLFARLAEDVRDVARAEVNVYRQVVIARATSAIVPIILIVTALILVIASVTTLMVGFALWLSQWIGAFGGGAASAVIGLLTAAYFVRVAATQFRRIGKPASESAS